MSKSSICVLLLIALFCACKSTSTNPLEGEKLRLITSDQDTASILYGPVVFTVTVLDASGYGVQGAYIDFYDPIEQRARHEGPTPEDGTLQIADTVSETSGGANLEFAFTAEHSGAITSDSVRLWVHKLDIRDWAIDSIWANSQNQSEIGVRWSRPSVDTGIDTVFVTLGNGEIETFSEPYPIDSATIYTYETGADTIKVNNIYASSRTIVWAPASTYNVFLYESADSVFDEYSGVYFADGEELATYNNYNFEALTDMIIATDPSNSMSGMTAISPSLSTLSGFTNGKTTAFYHPIQYIDNGTHLQQLYYPNDLSTYINGATPLYEIPLPDSSQYSTAFIAVTEEGHYAQVSVGPVTHDYNNRRYVNIELSYQPVVGLPYARTHKKPSPIH